MTETENHPRKEAKREKRTIVIRKTIVVKMGSNPQQSCLQLHCTIYLQEGKQREPQIDTCHF